MELGRGIVRAAILHPLTTTVHYKVEEEVTTTTTTFTDMVRCSEDLNTIYEEEDELSELLTTMLITIW